MVEETGKRLYYYAEDGEEFGPYTYQELIELPINEETLVWYKGLPEWACAGTLAELGCLFQTTPPPLPESVSPVRNAKNKHKTSPQNVAKRRRFMAIVLMSFA